MHFRCVVKSHGPSVACALRKSIAIADPAQWDWNFRKALGEKEGRARAGSRGGGGHFHIEGDGDVPLDRV